LIVTMQRWVWVFLVACSGGGATHPSSGSAAASVGDLDLGTSRAVPLAIDAAVIAVAPDAAPAPAPVLAAQGVDFIDDARLLFRVAACGAADTPVPAVLTGSDPKTTAQVTAIVDGHCKRILELIDKFRAAYFVKHREWFDAVVPKDIPQVVVYPFGGGDLLSALVAFPDATEITTISLELAGDPRRLRKLRPTQLSNSLGAIRLEIGGLLSVTSNTSENLSNQQDNELPGQVSSFLLALVAGGYEPVAMRYFKLGRAGEVAYLSQEDIDAVDQKRMKSLKDDWMNPNFSEAFAHVELQYKRPGESTIRVHRHFGWNLGNKYLTENPQLLRHLEAKGRVTMLTKGASYLLWRADFAQIRNYMLAHLAWMLSDSTGISPLYTKKANLVQDTYGVYNGAFLEGAQENPSDLAFIELWQKNKKRKLPFRFGYVDKDKQAHLVVTRPK
jgi:hypothetical protein